MSHTLKTDLIKFLTHLDAGHLPAKSRGEVSGIVSHLSAKDIVIPKSINSDHQLDQFLELFFAAYPALMTPANKDSLVQYLNNSRQDAIPRLHSHKK